MLDGNGRDTIMKSHDAMVRVWQEHITQRTCGVKRSVRTITYCNCMKKRAEEDRIMSHSVLECR